MGGTLIVPLRAATAETCGGKAAALGAMLRHGLPVPDGIVLPFTTRATDWTEAGAPLPEGLPDELAGALAEMGDRRVAVRSSAAAEDTAGASAAGQYQTVLAVRGAGPVGEAIRQCWAAAGTPGVAQYWSQVTGQAPTNPEMAVIVQLLIGADTSGVMFTAADGRSARIEASWGLGTSVVGGTVTPDTWQIGPGRSAGFTIGHKTTRVDARPGGAGLVASDVRVQQQDQLAIDEPAAAAIAALGSEVAALLGGPQDVEWAVAGGQVWLLQARPITAPAPPLPKDNINRSSDALTGTPGAHGRARGTARVLRNVAELGRVEPGDLVVCRYTDPSWTPLFRIAGGIVTETGGVLSHAAIVAREHRIPAVIGVPNATTAIPDAGTITLDGTRGTITLTTT